MKTHILIIKTLIVAFPLMFLTGDGSRPKVRPVKKELIVREPLQLQLLKIRYEAQRGQIILLQNAIQSKINTNH